MTIDTATAVQENITPAKKKKTSIKDMPGFDISSADMLAIIDSACMMVKTAKRGTVSVPALEMLTLELIGNEISVLGIDFDAGQVLSRGNVPSVFGDIKVSVPALELSNLMRSMKSEDNIRFRFHQDEAKLIIKTSKSTYKLPVFLGEIPVVEEEQLVPVFSLTLPAELLSQNIQRIIHCAAKNDVRYYMNGIFLNILHNALYVVATDGHRLASTRNSILFRDGPGEELDVPVCSVNMKKENVGVIVPISICPIIQKILKGHKGNFRLDFCSSNIIFNVGSVRLVCNLVSGRYPDWTKITQGIKNSDKSYSVSLSELRDALSRAVNLLASGAQAQSAPGGCHLAFSDKDIIISSPETNSIECEEIVSANLLEGAALKNNIGVNGHYILDCVAGMQSFGSALTEVEVHIRDLTSPIYFKYGDTIDVIMPLRI